MIKLDWREKMKFLVEPLNKSPKQKGECMPFCAGLCANNTSGCPYLCITKCSEKAVKCYKPAVPGMSPTGGKV